MAFLRASEICCIAGSTGFAAGFQTIDGNRDDQDYSYCHRLVKWREVEDNQARLQDEGKQPAEHCPHEMGPSAEQTGSADHRARDGSQSIIGMPSDVGRGETREVKRASNPTHDAGHNI